MESSAADSDCVCNLSGIDQADRAKEKGQKSTWESTITAAVQPARNIKRISHFIWKKYSSSRNRRRGYIPHPPNRIYPVICMRLSTIMWNMFQLKLNCQQLKCGSSSFLGHPTTSIKSHYGWNCHVVAFRNRVTHPANRIKIKKKKKKKKRPESATRSDINFRFYQH